MELIRVQEKELARRLRAIIKEDRAAKTKRQRIFRMSYKKRRKEFLKRARLETCATVGSVLWYGATGSHIEMSTGWDNNPAPLLLVNDLKLPTVCQFSPYDLGEYFRPGEDIPCLMRGSMEVLRADRKKTMFSNYAQYQVPLGVLERYIRRWKMTFLSFGEWMAWVEGMHGRQIIKRIRNKWDPYNGSWKDHFDHAVHFDFCRDLTVIVYGEIRDIEDQEKLNAIRKMWDIHQKIA